MGNSGVTDAMPGGGAAGQAGTTAGEFKIAVGSLLITEYVEGGKDKALEITNITDERLPLVSCQLNIYFNGKTQPGSKVPLEVELAPGATHVVCSGQSAADLLALCDQLSGSVSFNGDDAVTLECHGEVHDGIGQVGVQPVAGQWGTDAYGTADQVLRRTCSALPRIDVASEFDVTSDWQLVGPVVGEQRDFSGLGAADCAAPAEP